MQLKRKIIINAVVPVPMAPFVAGVAALIWPLVASAQVQDIRVVAYNTQGDVSSPTPTGVLPDIETVLEGIGEEKYAGDGIQQLPDIIGLEETTSNSETVAPIVTALNQFDLSTYGESNVYSYSSYQATESGGSATDGNGPNALIYNQKTLNLMASVPVDPLGGTMNLGATSGEYREVMRYQFQPLADTGTQKGIFYVYVVHAKSLADGNTTVDQTDQMEEATIIRNNELTLPSNASVIYMGDWNVDGSTDPSMTVMSATGQGQAFDPLNPTWASQDWAENNAYKAILTESDDDLRYRDDLQLMTANVLNDTPGSLNYIANSDHAFGNYGVTSEGGNIDSSANIAAMDDLFGPLTASQILAAMNADEGSDHLPVVADYFIAIPEPASLGVVMFAGTLFLRPRRGDRQS
jgi:hypothetical protein